MDTCSQLTFFVVENQHHGGQLTYQWLLREAASLGLSGGSAFRAVAGYGRHHLLHEARFYELAGELPMGSDLRGCTRRCTATHRTCRRIRTVAALLRAACAIGHDRRCLTLTACRVFPTRWRECTKACATAIVDSPGIGEQP
jgi:hypothetical protein